MLLVLTFLLYGVIGAALASNGVRIESISFWVIMGSVAAIEIALWTFGLLGGRKYDH